MFLLRKALNRLALGSSAALVALAVTESSYANSASDQPFSLRLDAGYFVSDFKAKQASGQDLADNFSTPLSFGFEIDLARGPSRSIGWKGVVALGAPGSPQDPRYFSTAVLGRYWLSGLNRIEHFTGEGKELFIAPIWRTSAFWDVGIAQLVVRRYGLILQTDSTLAQAGGGLSVDRRLTPRLWLSGEASAELAFGVSSVSVFGLFPRVSLGVVIEL